MISFTSFRNKLKGMFDPDASRNAHGSRTLFNVMLHCPTSIVFFFGGYLQHIVNTYDGNFEYALQVFDVPFNISLEAIGVASYFLGRQHAGEGAHHSSRNCTDYMIQGRSVLLDWIHLIEFLYPSMDTIEDRF